MVQPYGQIKKVPLTNLARKKEALTKDINQARETTQDINKMTGSDAVKLMKEALDDTTPDQVRSHLNSTELSEALAKTQFGIDLNSD